jgi:hypothetical protein
MLIIEINGKEKRVPTKHSELSLKKFSEIWKVLRKYDTSDKEEELDRDITDEEMTKSIQQEFDLTFELVSTLLEITIEEAKAMDFDVAMKITDIFNDTMLSEKHEKDMQGISFEHNGVDYYYPTLALNDLSFGEYAEMKQCEQILGKDVANRFDYLPRQMAILCKKKGEAKGEYDVTERENEFKGVTTDKALQFAFFLLKWTRNLQDNIQAYTENPQTFIQKCPILSTDTGGLIKYMMSLKTAYLPQEA